MAAIYPAPAYTTPVQPIPVDNDINNTTVSLPLRSRYCGQLYALISFPFEIAGFYW